jgi:MoaA/NifB/PqqE/SkfB family radical SAM enzyme
MSAAVSSPAPASAPLFKKLIAEDAPVTPRSAALFRFGEQCNNNCPMCSNTGEGGLFFHSTEELLRRGVYLREAGFRHVVVTGGEATIHPGFWTVVEQLAAHGIVWDINTHGRSFAKPDFARRAVACGLERAIVSLHSHDPATSAAIFGASETAHHETVAGIERLIEAGVAVMINCVLTRLNLPHVEDYLHAVVQRFGTGITVKFVFPSTVGVGGEWEGIAAMRYGDVVEQVRRLRALGAQLEVALRFESFPNCVLGDPSAVNLGRSAFGETHYLDDARGDRVYAMRHIEAELSAYGPACRECAAVRRCPGVSHRYATRFGVDELVPFPADAHASAPPAR